MSMHTPGPWNANLIEHLIGHDFPNLYSTRVNGVSKGAVAMAIGGNEEECDANARLIAAAPELLEALRDLLAEFDSYDKAMAEHGFGHEDYGQQRATARAAIAKAIGE